MYFQIRWLCGFFTFTINNLQLVWFLDKGGYFVVSKLYSVVLPVFETFAYKGRIICDLPASLFTSEPAHKCGIFIFVIMETFPLTKLRVLVQGFNLFCFTELMFRESKSNRRLKRKFVLLLPSHVAITNDLL